jgi:hypothetical protein
LLELETLDAAAMRQLVAESASLPAPMPGK